MIHLEIMKVIYLGDIHPWYLALPLDCRNSDAFKYPATRKSSLLML